MRLTQEAAPHACGRCPEETAVVDELFNCSLGLDLLHDLGVYLRVFFGRHTKQRQIAVLRRQEHRHGVAVAGGRKELLCPAFILKGFPRSPLKIGGPSRGFRH